GTSGPNPTRPNRASVGTASRSPQMDQAGVMPGRHSDVRRRPVWTQLPKNSTSAGDLGLRPVGAVGELLVHHALGVLIDDAVGVAGDALLPRGPAGGGEGGVVAREGLGIAALDPIGPAAVVLDDLILQVRHGGSSLRRPETCRQREPI